MLGEPGRAQIGRDVIGVQEVHGELDALAEELILVDGIARLVALYTSQVSAAETDRK